MTTKSLIIVVALIGGATVSILTGHGEYAGGFFAAGVILGLFGVF